jgi:hypothetical protein
MLLETRVPTPEANIRTYVDAAKTALEAGSYSEVRKQLVFVRMEMAKMPVEEDVTGLNFKNRMVSEINEISAAVKEIEQLDSGTRGPRRAIAGLS